MMSITRKGDGEIFLVAASAALVSLLPVDRGVSLAILLSRAHSTYQLARPKRTRRARLPNTTSWWAPTRDQPSETATGALVVAPPPPLTVINSTDSASH